MSDLTKRQFSGQVSTLQSDMDRALRGVRADLDATGDYTPGDATDWASPPPTTIAEALDRLAAQINIGAGAP